MGNGNYYRQNDREYQPRGRQDENFNRGRNGFRQEREPYDPSQEKVITVVGQIDIGKHGNQLVVELIRYKGTGPCNVRVRKVGTDRNTSEPFTSNAIGRLFPATALQLAQLLTIAARDAQTANAAENG